MQFYQRKEIWTNLSSYLFIDEAHLVFQEATDALLQQIETVIKLIRSKGVGIFFCTQNPQDIPASCIEPVRVKDSARPSGLYRRRP